MRWALPLLLAGCAVADPRVASPDVAGVSVEVGPGVIVAPGDGTAYLMRPGGGIEAVDLATGRVRWLGERAARPLVATERRVLAQLEPRDGRLTLVVLDARTGAPVGAEADVEMHGGARATIDPAPGESFSLVARRTAAGAHVVWRWARLHAEGVAPPEGQPVVARAEGAVEVEFAHGELVPTSVGDLTPVDPPPAFVLQRIEAGVAADAPRRIGGMWTLAELRDPATRAGLVLRRWRGTGEPLPEVTLIETPWRQLVRSVDGRHLCVDGAVFDVETGSRAGQWSSDGPAGPFVVAAGRVVFVVPRGGRRVDGTWIEEPLSLRAVELASGRQIWSRALRDLVHPSPPPL